MKVTIEKNELVIRLPLIEPKPSTSGKTLIVATSGGTVKTGVTHKGKEITVGVNAFIKKD